MPQTITLKIKRQDGKDEPSYWQMFQIPYRPGLNVVTALMDVRKSPRTVEGESVAPPVWECACLEEVCGSCTMLVNGQVRQSCSALVDEVGVVEGDEVYLSLEPMSKYPVMRDLLVDRSSMFENLKKIEGWIPVDGSYDLGPAQAQDDHVRQLRYALSRCMTCGCCMEACPQVNEKSSFVGPAAIAQVLLFNLHPVGKALASERLDFLTDEEGITGCGNAQNCVKVCPKDVPLTQAIAQLNRDTTVYRLKKWMGLSF